MDIKIFVGNLPFSATEDEVREKFAEFGEVSKVTLVTDRHTGQPRGFGFVEMESEAGRKAIASLNNQDFGGRPLRVDEAHSK